MKIAVTGKGGVGKTTIAGALARLYNDKGYKVLAVDADPDANLASAIIGASRLREKIVPISYMKKLIEERTGAKLGTMGSFFKINPKVDDIPEKVGVKFLGIRLLVLGGVEKGGSGCICPESALLRSLMRNLLFERDEVVVMDMEAGIEHLGRGTAESVDAFIVVVEPGLRSIETAKSIRSLAKDIGIKKVFLVVNKVRDGEKKRIEEKIKKEIPDVPIVGWLSENSKVRLADIEGKSAYDLDKLFVKEIDSL
ncbi:AAA family ATPase [Candidatus Oleimmundimicrobium sp.]|uniref:ATP-binding protein n=1 Tax=Candidatus Oleimmundimicrobium sp. TaxID=3060597 RepID=UPI00271D164E|nr:AAA family ATPase [Candidatus Oleimmundimicrobium sp.]MDO8886270.1 AAA family ATPase [Candidatus Oleimmundimicrobium sp.]